MMAPGRRWPLWGAYLALALCATGLATAQRRVNESGTVRADVEVEIYSVAGSVRVEAWDRDEFSIEGTLGDGVESLRVENDRGGLEIRTVVPRRRRRDPDFEVGETHLVIRLPRHASVEVETLAASIVVEDIDGRIRMESSAGDVSYRGAAAEIEADSAAGNIEVSTSSDVAEIDIEGVAGIIVVQLAGGEVSASTMTGSMRVLGGSLRRGDLESVSGSIYFEGAIASGGEIDIENFNGDIDLLIPGDTDCRFEITTYSGSIETEFGFEGTSVRQYSPELEADFVLGDGGNAKVSIEAFAGTVRVRRQ